MMKSLILWVVLGAIFCKAVQISNGWATLCPLIDKRRIFNVFYSEGRSVNSIALIQCRYAIQRIGDQSYRKCQLDGQWSGKNPICSGRAILCPLIDERGIFNVFYSEGQSINSIAFIQCRNVTQGIGDPSYRICKLDGLWSGKNPLCSDGCRIPSITNGSVKTINIPWTWNISFSGNSLKDLQAGSMVSNSSKLLFYCNAGYSISGRGARYVTIICLDGKLSHNFECLPDHCKIQRITNGQMMEQRKERNNTKLDYNIELKYINPGSIPSDTTKIFLFCDVGYSVNGTGVESVKLTCLQDRWSPIPACLPRQKN